jgi:hypothetical protein
LGIFIQFTDDTDGSGDDKWSGNESDVSRRGDGVKFVECCVE